MLKILKIAGLIIVSYILAEVGVVFAFLVRFAIDNSLINQLDKNNPSNTSTLSILDFLKLIHYGQILVILGIVGSSYISSLIFNKIFPGSKIKSFIALTIIWLIVIFILPPLVGIK